MPQWRRAGVGGRSANDRIVQQKMILFALSISPALNNLLVLVIAGDANNYFCGSSWSDASNNCYERQHCPGATDEECNTPGHICFSDTLCDASKGHGSSGALPYDHISNTLFCQAGWGEDPVECSVELWCGENWKCPGNLRCQYTSSCHLFDLIEIEEKKKAEEDAAEHKQLLLSMEPDDARRYNSCGMNWSDASAKVHFMK